MNREPNTVHMGDGEESLRPPGSATLIELDVLAERTSLGRYLATTSQPLYSLLFFLPLLVIYELYALAVNFDAPVQLRNGADVFFRHVLALLGIRSMLGFILTVVIGTSLVIIHHLHGRRERIKPGYLLLMPLESLLLAVLLAKVCDLLSLLTVTLLPLHVPAVPGTEEVMIAIGAGVYEELLFRLCAINGFMFLMKRWRMFEESSGKKALLAVSLSSVFFAAFHYLGTMGESFELYGFVYRSWAGFLLGLVYITRGIGITAWTHTAYDLMVLYGLI